MHGHLSSFTFHRRMLKAKSPEQNGKWPVFIRVMRQVLRQGYRYRVRAQNIQWTACFRLKIEYIGGAEIATVVPATQTW
jgi:hypothetical protein